MRGDWRVLTKKDARKLEMLMPRRILGATLKAKIRKEEVRRRTLVTREWGMQSIEINKMRHVFGGMNSINTYLDIYH